MRLLLALTCGLSAAQAASADTLTVNPTADNTLYLQSAGTLSNGAGTGMFVGVAGNGQPRRAVLRFDVASQIPAGSTINSAELTLNVTISASSTPKAVTVHRLTSDWGEAGSFAGAGQGAGGPALPGDATWIHTFSPNSNWTTAGGDFIASASTQTLVGSSGAQVFSGAGMVADVQAWVDGAAGDFGWLLMDDETNISARRYATREFASLAPVLVVEFDPPAGFGSVICSTGANSTGAGATIAASGSPVVSANSFTITSTNLPANQFGIYVTSMTRVPLGSNNLCIGGMIGRFVLPSQILSSGAVGTISLTPDLGAFPQGNGTVAVSPGETWYFQGWFRDTVAPGSNFTDGLEVVFI